MAAPLLLSPKFVDVDRDLRVATLWRRRLRRYKAEKTYKVAIGRVGFETPAGLYWVERKDRNPTWTPPDSEWVTPAMRDDSGKPIPIPPGDPRNPLVKAFIAISGGDAIGFHGTADLASIGTQASHGCIRMYPDDVADPHPAW